MNYNFPKGILSCDENLTKRNFLKASEFVKKDIKDYNKKYGFKKIVLVGVSLGGVLAFLVANGNKHINKLVSINTGYGLAESLWTGIVTKKLRKGFEKKGVDLRALKKAWSKITPAKNIGKLKGKEIVMFISESDKVINWDQGIKMFKALKKKRYKVDLHINKFLGHYLTIYFSYKKFDLFDN